MSPLNQIPSVDPEALVIDESGSADLTAANDPHADDFTGQVLSGSTDNCVPPLLDKPVLRLVDADFKATCESAEQIMSSCVYAQGTGLVRIGHAYEVRETDALTDKGRSIGQDGIERNPAQCFLIPVTKEYIERELSGLAVIERPMADGTWKSVSCPERLANNILRHGNSPNFRPLAGIARAPFIRSDGSVCDEPGYDARSQTLYIPNADFPELPGRVSEDEARDALAVLLDPFSEFPFATGSARSAFAAHILTEAARVALDRVPMFTYSAAFAGTGKSLLSEMAATIVHGVEPSLRDWVDDQEMRKTLFASAVAGDRSVQFDNLPKGHKVRSATLCKFITGRISTERVLGETKVITVPNLAVVSISGNNISPVGDLARRSLVIRLDADMPSADLKARTFRIEDLRHYVLEHRVELLTAALTVIRGHQQSGQKGPTPMQSFDRWSKFVRNALLWLGMDDPLETQAQETDDETGNLDDAFRLLGAAFSDEEFTAQDIAQRAGGILDASGELSGALIKAGCAEPNSTVKIGYWLRNVRDEFGAGYKLIKVDDRHRGSGTRWRLKPSAKLAPGTSPAADNWDLVRGSVS
jgi:hypothetical protein